MSCRSIIIFIISFFSTTLYAQFYVEPQLGWIGGSYEQYFNDATISIVNTSPARTTTVGPSNTIAQGSANGLGIGMKLGYDFSVIFLGVNFSYGIINFTPTGSNDINEKYSVKNANLGVFAGLNIPFLPRIWVGYNPNDSLILSDIYGTEDKYKGTSTYFGISFFTSVRLNIEYGMHTYDERDGRKLPYYINETETIGTATATIIGTEQNLEYKSILVSLSLPISF